LSCCPAFEQCLVIWALVTYQPLCFLLVNACEPNDINIMFSKYDVYVYDVLQVEWKLHWSATRP
jgi:hypothetical protein